MRLSLLRPGLHVPWRRADRLLSASCVRRQEPGLQMASPAAGGSGALKRVSLEGNIAVGKSTFARLLEKTDRQWEIVAEPLSKWQNVASAGSSKVSSSRETGANLLQMLYEDPSRWSYTFQTYSFMSRIKAHLVPASQSLLSMERPVQVFERSVYSDRYVFALNLFKLGFINATEWTIYQDWHTFLLNQFHKGIALEGIVYLQASPQVCLERLRRRARSEEKGLQLDYLESLHLRHEDWFIKKSTEVHFEHLRNIPLLVLDVNEEFEDDEEKQERLMEKVKNFVNNL
ncbi:deoxycytidine kinase 2 [Latimeria chalumnae]|uniref:deoxyguanosine kinase n=1 Tax=Latimeria chalumnae TaxID=7897 RepID=H3A628_LATCH|nr:PREDICTED: deoxyguanosine kinase, mitochondrial [Latimeria chalumnae]|eukprot:XP_014350382.1 PREDICTED: deoxyguanosine kinase, mitochondrial [Latimeria chalumnae]